jgi:hypothetical protein
VDRKVRRTGRRRRLVGQREGSRKKEEEKEADTAAGPAYLRKQSTPRRFG